MKRENEKIAIVFTHDRKTDTPGAQNSGFFLGELRGLDIAQIHFQEIGKNRTLIEGARAVVVIAGTEAMGVAVRSAVQELVRQDIGSKLFILRTDDQHEGVNLADGADPESAHSRFNKRLRYVVGLVRNRLSPDQSIIETPRKTA